MTTRNLSPITKDDEKVLRALFEADKGETAFVPATALKCDSATRGAALAKLVRRGYAEKSESSPGNYVYGITNAGRAAWIYTDALRAKDARPKLTPAQAQALLALTPGAPMQRLDTNLYRPATLAALIQRGYIACDLVEFTSAWQLTNRLFKLTPVGVTVRWNVKKQKRRAGAPVHESGYPLHVVKMVERAGWDVAQTTDGSGDWYAYWDSTPLQRECPLAWASSCESIDDIHKGLLEQRRQEKEKS